MAGSKRQVKKVVKKRAPNKQISKKKIIDTIEYEGKTHEYTRGNYAELAKKLNLPVYAVKDLIHDDGRRFATSRKNRAIGPIPFNIKTEDFTGLLRRDFVNNDLKRISKKDRADLITMGDNHTIARGVNKVARDANEIDFMRQLTPNTEGEYSINIYMYIDWDSDQIKLETVLKDVHLQRYLGFNDDEKSAFQIMFDLYPLRANEYFDFEKVKRALLDRGQEPRELTLSFPDIVYGYTKNKEIPDSVRQHVWDYMLDISHGNPRLLYYSFRIYSTYQHRRLHFNKGYIREEPEDVLKLSQWVNIEYNRDYNGEDSCFVQFIRKNYEPIYWEIKNKETIHGVTMEDCIEFCENNNLHLKLYDVDGGEIENDIPEHMIYCREKHKIPYVHTIVGIIHNNHFYRLLGGKPKRYRPKEYELTVSKKDAEVELIEILTKKKILPEKIIIGDVPFKSTLNKDGTVSLDKPKIPVLSCIMGDKKIVWNSDYKKVLKILDEVKKDIGIDYTEYINERMKLSSIMRVLEKASKVPDTSSFFPNKNDYKTGQLLYKIHKFDKKKHTKVSTIDKNKCYAYVLMNLPYLIKFDYRKNAINLFPTQIIPTNLYLAKPLNKWTTLMPVTKLYAGYFLEECLKAGCEFELLEELECEYEANHFTELIPALFRAMPEYINGVKNTDFKKMINKFIGCFEMNQIMTQKYKYANIYTNESAKQESGFMIDIGDKHKLKFNKTDKYTSCRDRIPIATQVKDGARLLLYKKIRELDIKDEDIVQISTDSVSYYGKLPKGLDATTLEGWKSDDPSDVGDANNFTDKTYDSEKNKIRTERILERMKERQEHHGVIYTEEELSDICPISLANLGYNEERHTNTAYLQYGGAGKTFIILNELIPKLKKEKKSYIVLTPSHKTLQEYKTAGVNCKIISGYVFENTIPKEDHIIIDEVGFVDLRGHDLLYRIKMAKKGYTWFGDFNQLMPVGEKVRINQPHYLRYMFGENIVTKFVNKRNNYSQQFYDTIRAEPNKSHFLTQQVKYWSDSNSTNLVCYRNKTKAKWNNHILKKEGYIKMNSVGVKIICVKNTLVNRGMFNSKLFTIIYKEEKSYQIECEKGNIYQITKKELLSNFRLGYVLNLHQIQGSTLDSYKWIDEDNSMLTGTRAYVLISRLKQEITKEKYYLEKREIKADYIYTGCVYNKMKVIKK